MQHDQLRTGAMASRSIANNMSSAGISRPAVTSVFPVQRMMSEDSEEVPPHVRRIEKKLSPEKRRAKKKRQKVNKRRREKPNEEDGQIQEENGKKRRIELGTNDLTKVETTVLEDEEEAEVVEEESKDEIKKPVEDLKERNLLARRERAREKRERKVANREGKRRQRQDKKNAVSIPQEYFEHILEHSKRDSLSKSLHGIFSSSKPAAIRVLVMEGANMAMHAQGIVAREKPRKVKGAGIETGYIIDMGKSIGIEAGTKGSGEPCRYLQIVLIQYGNGTIVKSAFPTSSTDLKH